MKYCFFLFMIFLAACSDAQNRVTFLVDAPAGTTKIYIAGDFNNWDPAANPMIYDSLLKRWKYILMTTKRSVEYKFTKGSWNSVEETAGGADVPNHKLAVDGDQTIVLRVESWKSVEASAKTSTLSGELRIIDSFFMPGLSRYRTIRILLPQGYNGSAEKYPVIYMHDGQNLFDAATAAFGEWRVDESIQNVGGKPPIIVGIDNGPKRLTEYNPYNTSRFGNGEGAPYVKFIVETLKPFIDKEFRTMPGPVHTSIAGSSMGGLISLYAVLKYPGVFGSAGVFSPSLWIAPDMYKLMKTTGKGNKRKIFLYAGGKESAGMVNELNKAKKELEDKTGATVHSIVVMSASHDEAAWSAVFPQYLQWIRQDW